MLMPIVFYFQLSIFCLTLTSSKLLSEYERNRLIEILKKELTEDESKSDQASVNSKDSDALTPQSEKELISESRILEDETKHGHHHPHHPHHDHDLDATSNDTDPEESSTLLPPYGDHNETGSSHEPHIHVATVKVPTDEGTSDAEDEMKKLLVEGERLDDELKSVLRKMRTLRKCSSLNEGCGSTLGLKGCCKGLKCSSRGVCLLDCVTVGESCAENWFCCGQSQCLNGICS